MMRTSRRQPKAKTTTTPKTSKYKSSTVSRSLSTLSLSGTPVSSTVAPRHSIKLRVSTQSSSSSRISSSSTTPVAARRFTVAAADSAETVQPTVSAQAEAQARSVASTPGRIYGDRDLHKAAALGDLATLEKILQQDPSTYNIHSLNHYKLPAIVLATKNNQRITMRELVKSGANINQECGRGLPPFYHAIKTDDIDTVRTVVKLGGYPSFVAKENTSPLGWATRVKASAKILRFLVKEQKMRPNHRDVHGRTPIMFAAQRGKIPEIEYLLSVGADICAVDKSNRDILWYVKTRHDKNIVKFVTNALQSARYKKKLAVEEARLKQIAANAEHQAALKNAESSHAGTVAH